MITPPSASTVIAPVVVSAASALRKFPPAMTDADVLLVLLTSTCVDDVVDPSKTAPSVEFKVSPALICTLTLDYGEPTGQEAFDNTTDFNGDYVFDELGLKSWEGTENGSSNKLLTHVVFHPVQKSLNRLIQIDYTIRIQSLTTFTE